MLAGKIVCFFAERGKRRKPENTLGVRLISTNHSPRTSRLAGVGGSTDDGHCHVISLDSVIVIFPNTDPFLAIFSTQVSNRYSLPLIKFCDFLHLLRK